MDKYLKNIAIKFSDSQTSEMGYRTDFENLLETIFPKEQKYLIHHDARSVGGNKPDFIVLKNGVPILYIENKDVGVDLDKIEKSNQMDRYFGYANLILTDQVEFRFYRNGEKYSEPIKIATYEKSSRSISSIPENFKLLEKTIVDFTLLHKEPIKRGKHLAQIMGGKAKRIRGNVLDILERSEETDIHKVYNTIKKLLVHDLGNLAFADMYAQTLVYGLFVARFYDESGDSFSRQEARELVPKSNPFLAHFFDHISGVNFEKRLSYIVDELCDVFSHANIPDLMDQYFGKDLWGNDKEGPDPVIHFYEDFLREYDPELRKKMGAYYTPTPVVRFIVRSIDEILQKEFNIPKGLADTSKYDNGVHKVQVLDPATGTGTFISAAIRLIYEKIIASGQKGTWASYVHHDLLPRIHAFELMMGPYTIAHLKLSMAFEKTGFKYFNNTRLGIYLTNSLEESTQNDLGFGDLGLSGSIAEESKQASKIKNEKPVMVVLGNPPYSGESNNAFYKGHDVYKVEPGGKVKLKERNSKWINDDYVKFIRFAENLIEKNGQGIIGMITAHGYIDNPTFRGMRWHLRKTFDKIYVIDLHGSANKKEMSPDGSKDENVFAIKTGVAIILGVKNGKKAGDELAKVFKADLYGAQEDKFAKLNGGNISEFAWTELPQKTDIWILEGEGKSEYRKGFSVAEIFSVNSVGVVTAKDAVLINNSKTELLKNVAEFYKISPNESFVQKISYRPFDNKFVYFDTDLVERSREKVMQYYIHKENLGLLSTKSVRDPLYSHVFVVNSISEAIFISGTTATNAMNHPLYLYTDQNEKIPNIDKEIWQKINEVAGETTPENILDYVYAVLHSPNYCEKYKEFLKIDFPRVPYPENKEKFFALAKLGEKLRGLHLMTAPEVNELITTFPMGGNDEIEKITYKDGNVYINSMQYFGDVPEIAWNFYIGGYQPAQKYLKDRKGRKLSNEEIEHYQKIIKVLVETDKIMKEIGMFF